MLKVGVIGCGGMGRDHIKRLTERTQGAQVVAVSDVFEEGAKKAAQIAGGAKVYTDSKALISDPEVEARNLFVRRRTTAERSWRRRLLPENI